MACPYGPSSRKFSIKRCILCRATNRIGYLTRKMICDRERSFGRELEYKKLYGGFYNFECPHFDWNLRRKLKCPGQTEKLSLEGVPPLGPNDCEHNRSGYCERFKKKISTTVGLSGSKIGIDGKIPICEICMISYNYSKQLEKLLSDASFPK